MGSSFGGNDVIDAGEGDDRAYGDAFQMWDRARGGDDTLRGCSGKGRDGLFGDAFTLNDTSQGGADRIEGGGSDDFLGGGTGSDLLVGDFAVLRDGEGAVGGKDRFAFAKGSGREVVFDFQNGQDKLEVSKDAGIDDFRDVSRHARAVEGGVVIDLGAAAGGRAGVDMVGLYGFDLKDLSAGDFVF